MASFEPTPAQQAAIETTGKDILVSASAGSGKTAVLVERVIALLKKEPDLSIDQFLLVTFTKEAAKNMRDRIRQALQAESANQHLKAQLSRLPLANISTIHAFCEQVIKQYYYEIGLDPRYRLLTDATEQALLKEQVWNELQEAALAADDQDPARPFAGLKQAFSDPQQGLGEGLAEVVFKLDEVANAQPQPTAWLDQQLANYQWEEGEDYTQTSFYRQQLCPHLRRQVTAFLAEWQQLEKALGETAFADHYEVVAGDCQKLVDLKVALEDEDSSWASTREKFQQKFGTWPRKKLDPADKEAVAAFKSQRDALKKRWDQALGDYFGTDQDRLYARTTTAARFLAQLVAVAKDFRARYQAAKRTQHLVDFADLEHFAFQILETAPQARAALQHRFKEIMVDEYQDTNALQDELIAKLHAPGTNHLFMVGDAKQSIYAFRQADPTLFAHHYQDFGQEDNQQATAIDLAENFRSMESVTTFVNQVFTQLMDQALSDQDYDQRAALRYAAKYYQPASNPRPAPEILVYDDQEAPETADPLEKRVAEGEGEIYLVGMRIKQLLAGDEQIFDAKLGKMRPLRAGDIAILSRRRRLNNAIVEQFAALEIPVVVHDVENYFKATEVQTVLSLLKVIDNPAQDIPLVATLRSPLVGMTERELAFIRVNHREDDFYTALTAVAAQLADPEGRDQLAARWAELDLEAPAKRGPVPVSFATFAKRVTTFLDQLAHFREVAERQSLVDLIWQIYQTTNYLDYVGAMPGGNQRQANLHALYQRAHAYEKGTFRGLYQFITFIERMQKRDKDLAQAPGELVEDAVNVLTIHGSKGLQFPVVFLIDTNSQFNTQVKTDSLVVDPFAGIGLSFSVPLTAASPTSPLTDPLANDDLLPVRGHYRLPQHDLVVARLLANEQAEEMRLLYVALTRAEQRLIITATLKKDRAGLAKHWQAAAASPAPVLPVSLRQEGKTFFDWLGMTLARKEAALPTLLGEEDQWAPAAQADQPVKLAYYTAATVAAGLSTTAPATPVSTPAASGPTLTKAERDFIVKTLAFTYPHPAATKTTAYQSVSAIRDLFVSQDPDEARMGHLAFDRGAIKEEGRYLRGDFGTPAFLERTPQAATPAAVGTATHLVFQQLPLDQGAVTPALVEETIARLLKEGLIENPELAAKIKVDGIVAFYQTPLGQRLLSAPHQVAREQPFSMLLSGDALFTNLAPGDGELLIHGIIDGYLESAAGIELFDYKTDRVAPGGEQAIIDRYQGQVNLYRQALNQMKAPKTVTHAYLYLVGIGELCEV